jgi:hypothetical protein
MMEPKVKHELESLHVAPGSYAYHLDHHALLESTGHRKVNGKWVGNDPFLVYRYEENPGLGVERNFDFHGSYRPWDTDLSGYSHSWRPTLCRYFDNLGNRLGELTDVVPPRPSPDGFEEWHLFLNSLGTKFIRNARPGNPTASLAQFVGELRDIPRIPRYLKQRLASIKLHQHADEYLNVEFGWRPFLADLYKAYKTSSTLTERLSQLVRDNGLRIRRQRRVVFDDPLTETLCDYHVDGPFGINGYGINRFGVDGLNNLTSDEPTGFDDLNSFRISDVFGIMPEWGGLTNNLLSLDFKVEKKTEVFGRGTGTFTYYVPDIGSSEWTQKAINVLFGANPTPLVLWELLPWSWLIGWWANADDVISNAMSNAVDNEVYDNCSVTYEKRVTITATADISWQSWSVSMSDGTSLTIPGGTDHLKWTSFEHYQMRQAANPFGFGITFDSLTARQWAILAALGISRKR